VFCERCGSQITAGSAFCPGCGRALEGGSATLAPGRIARHIQVLGILWLVLAAFRVLPGLVLVGLAAAGAAFLPPEVPAFVHAILPAIGAVFLFTGAVGIVVGWGLLAKQSWARMAAIVIGAINLFDLPFGTALGIYTLWVLVPAASEREYRAAAAA
jgi:hypothetical protein